MTKSRKGMLEVVVVGGSLGGLMSGITLQRLGHNVRILERSPLGAVHSQGAGIVAGGATQEFFATYDRTKTPIGIASHARQYLRKDGGIMDFENRQQRMTSWDLLYNILRANFDQKANTDYCQNPEKEIGDGEGEMLHDHLVTSISKDGTMLRIEGTVKGEPMEPLRADLIIGADGPSSTIRQFLTPEVQRKYCGYVAWRGTVNEKDLSERTHNDLAHKFTFFHAPHLQMLSYLIPGQNGTLEPGQRLMNFVWYMNYPEGSKEFRDVMTGASMKEHHFTNGDVDPQKFNLQKTIAAKRLPPQFLELVEKTQSPFIQKITDVKSTHHVFWDGKVILVGDAMCGLRPHTAASTSQAAMHALLLSKVLEVGGGSSGEEMSLNAWDLKTRNWAESMSKSGIEMGDTSQFGKHPLQDDS